MKVLQVIGFWSGAPDSRGCWLHPSVLVTPGFYGEEKGRLVAYLKSGHLISAQLGYSFCRFEGGPPDREMGCRDLTDGTWLWPEGLWVYVDRYDVKLPEEFLTY